MAEKRVATIVDYGMGNLRSVERALTVAGAAAQISRDPKVVRNSRMLILPGVGAFGDAMENLKASGLDNAILAAVGDGVPMLGLCLGLQLLFMESEEFGRHKGLGLIPGMVRRLDAPGLRVPHVGWNQVEDCRPDSLMTRIPDGSYFYFLHSFYVEPEADADILCRTEYGLRFCSVARRGQVWGAQFHPEKSQEAGRQLLRNFLSVIEGSDGH